MRTEPYKNKAGKERFRPVLECFEDMEDGFCIGCGEQASCVEPDAERYECESCGQNLVYGVEDLLIRGIAYTDF